MTKPDNQGWWQDHVRLVPADELIELPQQAHDNCLVCSINASSRLITEKNLRFEDQDPCQGHALRFSP